MLSVQHGNFEPLYINSHYIKVQMKNKNDYSRMLICMAFNIVQNYRTRDNKMDISSNKVTGTCRESILARPSLTCSEVQRGTVQSSHTHSPPSQCSFDRAVRGSLTHRVRTCRWMPGAGS